MDEQNVQNKKKQKKNARHYEKKGGGEKMHGGEIVFDYSCFPFRFFSPTFVAQEKSEDMK